MKILLGISGSSSTHLGLKLLRNLEDKCELYCITTEGAKISFGAENKENLEKTCQKQFQNICFLNDNNLSASVISRSFSTEKTIIAPCSISSLAKTHAGLADTPLMRAAAVALKERKSLILGVREMPFSTLILGHVHKLSQPGVIIAPPIIASYPHASNLEQMENFIIGKWLDLLGISHNLYERWRNFWLKSVIFLKIFGAKITCLYPGTFNPITNGHLDVIKRVLKIFDKVIVAITNSEHKRPCSSLEQRKELAKLTTSHLNNVEIITFDSLLVGLAKELKVNTIARGLRAVSGFKCELQIGYANHALWEEIETIYLTPNLKNAFISSSVVRSIASHGGDISTLVPKEILPFLKNLPCM